MILKERPEDFRVMESLVPGFLGEEGPHRVYRVTKKKLTTLEAIDLIAKAAGVDKSGVSYAGLKDRQGITVQYVSLEKGQDVAINSPELKVGLAGKSREPVTSEVVTGNLFDIIVRGLGREELAPFRENLNQVKKFGLPNYFDDQRFGCVRHGQGFIVRDILRGKMADALKALIAAPSPFHSPEDAGFKNALRKNWGNWEKCATITKRRQYESLFQHLAAHPEDFAGAFRKIASRIRLIHLYAYQSYLWNKSLGLYLRDQVEEDNLVSLSGDVGPLVCHRTLDGGKLTRMKRETFPLLDPKIKIEDPSKRRAVDAVLRTERLKREELQVKGIPGFIFKGEERPLLLFPSYLRVKPPYWDPAHRGQKKVELRFKLPSGSYATLVVKRLFAPGREQPKPRGGHPPRRARKRIRS